MTSAGDVSPEIKLSRTSSLPRPAGISLNATILSLYTSPLWILAEGRRSGLVRELPGTGSKASEYGQSDASETAAFRVAS
ncbi:hypothetical protein BKM03_17190 [Pseudomonas avellanae]|uniref:Uncharacterized protein n=1 Tax=Pseudomonas avellanae TaxID=46257 RepID=A0AAD0DZC4_9PSED|nr:hypothetical protein BKM03_17190 [Pseudomonas avellanae]POP84530.1 hypothetical protein CXB34_21775 [Pseudomonas amygdali pv. morsprunorum]